MPPKGLSIFAIRTANSRGWCPYFPVGARNQRTSFSLTDFKKNFLENRMKATSRIKKKVIYTVSTGGRTASNFNGSNPICPAPLAGVTNTRHRSYSIDHRHNTGRPAAADGGCPIIFSDHWQWSSAPRPSLSAAASVCSFQLFSSPRALQIYF